jgi:uncharacterized protein YjgD (DUF1641 family)
MAPRIQYDVKPPHIGPDAHDELAQLLQTLHRHGFLRLANDLVGANQEVAQVLVNGLSRQGTLNAIQNLSILLMALSQIPPNEFYKVTFALRDALHEFVAAPDGEQQRAPGLSGAYRALHDEEFWDALRPLLAGIKQFAAGLERDVDKPISAFTGKPSRA